MSEHLTCDGNENCPNGASTSDEDDRLCKSHLKVQGSWEQFVAEIMRKLKPPAQLINNKWLQSKLTKDTNAATTQGSKLIEWKEWQELRVTRMQEGQLNEQKLC